MDGLQLKSLQLYNWQVTDYNYLISLNKRLPGAILLISPDGLGTTNLIKYWVQALLCENLNEGSFCNSCSSCTLLNEESHPDLFTIKLAEDSKNIAVSEIRLAIDFVSLSVHLAKRKIVVCEDLSLLSISAANALLKVLEEPPQNSLFILFSNNLGKVLPTIRSRCHKYFLTPPTNEMLQSALASSDTPNAEFWIDYYANCPLFELEVTESQLDTIIETLLKPSIDNIFKFSQEIDGKTVKFGFVVEFLTKWISDLTSLKFANSARYFKFYQDKMVKLIDRLDPKKVFYLNDQICFLAKWTNHPLNYKLQIENLLFQYQQLFVK